MKITLANTSLLLIGAFYIITAFCNLPSLNIGDDEAIYLSASKTLAEDGVYGIKTNYGYIPYWQKIRGGPTIIVPTAILFKIFGFNPFLPRYLNTFISISAGFILFCLTKKLFGQRTALLALFFLSISFYLPIEDTSIYTPINRYLNGEMLALLFLLLFMLAFHKYTKCESAKNLGVSGLLLGLSALTKMHFLIILLPTIIVLYNRTAHYNKNKRLMTFAIATIAALLPLTFWVLWAGEHSELGLYEYTKLFFNFEGKPLSHSIIKWGQNLYGIFQIAPNTLEPIILFPSLALSFYRIINCEDKNKQTKMLLLLTVCFWMVWYCVSAGYPRYLMPGILIGNIFTAWTFTHFLKNKAAVPFFAVTLILVITPALTLTLQRTIKTNETKWVTPLKDAVYELIPKNSKIEIKDFELYSLSKDYQIQTTPLKVDNYDPAYEGFNYIIGGFFDDYSLYEYTLNKHRWEEIYSNGAYRIYKLISL